MAIETVPSLEAFFRDALTTAEQRLRVRTPEDTGEYLTGLLTRLAVGAQEAGPHRSVVLSLDAALEQGPGAQLLALQSVGDEAMTSLALFPEQVARHQVEPGLYHRIGSFAYGRAADLAHRAGTRNPAVLLDLQAHFPSYVALVNEVATSSALGAMARDVVKLFDRWKTTGNVRALEELARQGAFPTRGGHRC